MRIFLVIASVATGLRLRSKDSDFGCSDPNDGSCITPDSISAPSALNPATISTSTDSNGYLTAFAIEGDAPDDPGAPDDEEQNLVNQFLISSPQLAQPPTPLPLIVCVYDACTTTPDPEAASATTASP